MDPIFKDPEFQKLSPEDKELALKVRREELELAARRAYLEKLPPEERELAARREEREKERQHELELAKLQAQQNQIPKEGAAFMRS